MLRISRPGSYLFTGRVYDAETALYYYRARYYDYYTARFLQPDPIGYADGLNLYSYCGNDSINWVDPYGLIGVAEAAAAAGVATKVVPSLPLVTLEAGSAVAAVGTTGAVVVTAGGGYVAGRYIGEKTGLSDLFVDLVDAIGERLYDHIIHLKNKENEERARKAARQRKLRKKLREDNIGHTTKGDPEKHTAADGHISRIRHRRRMQGLEGIVPWLPFGFDDEDEKKW